MFALTINFPLLFITSFFIYGFNYCTQSGNVFGLLDKFNNNQWYLRPLYTCPICMSSFWGGLFYILFTKFYFDADYIINLCVHVVALAGLIRLLRNFT